MMKRLPDLLAAIATTAWVGGLWAIGFLAAPVLFYKLADRHLAGQLAGEMFRLMAWVGIGCGSYLIVFRIARSGAAAARQIAFWATVSMLVLLLVGLFGIQPVMEKLRDQMFAQGVVENIYRDRFAHWHGISSAVWLLECLLGVLLVLESRAAKRSAR